MELGAGPPEAGDGIDADVPSGEEGADEVHHRGHGERDARGERAGRHGGGDGVGGVVESVGVVEDEGDDDHRDDDREFHLGVLSFP